MKELGLKQEKERTEHIQSLRTAHEKLEDAVNVFNTALTAASEALQEALETYNAEVDEANGFRDDIYNSIIEYIESHTEKWQESESGQNYLAWSEEWNIDFLPVDIDIPESIDLDSDSVADLLEDLSSEPSL